MVGQWLAIRQAALRLCTRKQGGLVGLIQLTPPDEEPFDTTAAKLHLRETNTDQDALIGSLIVAARERAETFTRRAFIEQSWKLTLDSFPCGGGSILDRFNSRSLSDRCIRIPMPPLISVESVKYIDLGGVLQTMDPADYSVDIGSLPGKIDLGYGLPWPSARAEANAVRIEFTCGYGEATDVPALIKAAMKLDIGHLFENRESVLVGANAAELPMASQNLLWNFRVMELQ